MGSTPCPTGQSATGDPLSGLLSSCSTTAFNSDMLRHIKCDNEKKILKYAIFSHTVYYISTSCCCSSRGECRGVVQSAPRPRLRALQYQPLHRPDHNHLLPGQRAAGTLHPQRYHTLMSKAALQLTLLKLITSDCCN